MLRYLCLAALCLSAFGQPIFECQAPGTFPVLPAVDCELVGVSVSSSTLPYPSISATPTCGLPGLGGLQWAYVTPGGDNGGSVVIPAGGPIPRPLSPFVHELRIPIPSGATSVSFLWEFFNGEGTSIPYNDAFEVSVVDSSGNIVGAPLVYCDTQIAGGSAGPCADLASGYPELGAPVGVDNGPQIVAVNLPSYPPGSYLSVVATNTQDEVVSSPGAIDDVFFSNLPVCSFNVTQPTGAGSLRVEIANCGAGQTYLVPATTAPGSFPNGWCLGVDISISELLGQIGAGGPFYGVLDGTGGSVFSLTGGVPSGISIWANCGLFAPGGGPLVQQFVPLTFTTL